MFVFRDHLDLDPGASRVEIGFTDASLDLQGGDDRPAFAGDLARVVEEAGVPFARLSQVHGAEVVEVVDEPPRGPAEVPSADGLVTVRPRTGLMIRTADCVPVLLADAVSGVIGAAHAGRAGTALGVVPRTAARMRELGAQRLHAWIGPHVCGRCYEVPAQMRAEVAAVVPQTFSETHAGTPALDLGAGVRAQLEAEQVSVVEVPGCTLEDGALHSYRRDGAAAGRLAGLVWRR
ncbi:polyphenol oxidase family protein [Nocardioides sambongensis]|uniref:polyphenol oxidase family protein n=1 Tax=Nocardioides sambongensis TaxID=2589074 RepID=UPI00112AEF09|nr:polyphenol oxidase family protein [Nocardioides sambongensis]